MGGFGGMNINSLMKEAKKMQAEMEKSQTELASKEFEASAGGGAISVKVSGEKMIKEIKIKPEVVDPEETKEEVKIEKNDEEVIKEKKEKEADEAKIETEEIKEQERNQRLAAKRALERKEQLEKAELDKRYQQSLLEAAWLYGRNLL